MQNIGLMFLLLIVLSYVKPEGYLQGWPLALLVVSMALVFAGDIIDGMSGDK